MDCFTLLCRCLRTSGADEDLLLGLRESKTAPDWNGVVKLADSHFVLPLLHHRMAHNNTSTLLPQELGQLLTEVHRLNRNRCRLIRNEIARIAGLLNPAGIEPLFLKGAAALLMDIYEEDGLRVMNDVDFLVRQEERKTCVQLMTDAGYYPMEIDGLSEVFRDDHYHECPLVHDSHNIRFEIHGRLEQNPILDSQTLLNESTSLQTAGGVVRVPGSNHFVMHNILHHQVFNHGLDRKNTPLYQLLDLQAIFSKPQAHQLDWPQIQQFFSSPSLRDPFHNALHLLQEYMGEKPPIKIPFSFPYRLRYRRLRLRINNYQRQRKKLGS